MNPFSPVLAASAPTGMGGGGWGTGGRGGFIEFLLPQGPLFLICTKAWSEPGSLLCLILSFLLWSSTLQGLVVVGT